MTAVLQHLILFYQQSELVDLAENIQQKLSYFNELENINTVCVTYALFSFKFPQVDILCIHIIGECETL